jgi:hypothetical protein
VAVPVLGVRDAAGWAAWAAERGEPALATGVAVQARRPVIGERLRGTWHGLLGADKGVAARDAAAAVEHAMRDCLAAVRHRVPLHALYHIYGGSCVEGGGGCSATVSHTRRGWLDVDVTLASLAQAPEEARDELMAAARRDGVLRFELLGDLLLLLPHQLAGVTWQPVVSRRAPSISLLPSHPPQWTISADRV